MNPDAEHLAADNLGIAYKVATLAHNNSGGRADFDDLRGAAVVGLVRAAKAYDPARGTKFSTVAWKYCRNACSSSVSADVRRHKQGFRVQSLDALPWRQRQQIVDAHPGPVADLEAQQTRTIERAAVRRILDGLDEKQRIVLLGRLNGETLAEIGERIGATKEWVNQINAGVWAWIRGEQSFPKPMIASKQAHRDGVSHNARCRASDPNCAA